MVGSRRAVDGARRNRHAVIHGNRLVGKQREVCARSRGAVWQGAIAACAAQDIGADDDVDRIDQHGASLATAHAVGTELAASQLDGVFRAELDEAAIAAAPGRGIDQRSPARYGIVVGPDVDRTAGGICTVAAHRKVRPGIKLDVAARIDADVAAAHADTARRGNHATHRHAVIGNDLDPAFPDDHVGRRIQPVGIDDVAEVGRAADKTRAAIDRTGDGNAAGVEFDAIDGIDLALDRDQAGSISRGGAAH